jgi:hypothetical protein
MNTENKNTGKFVVVYDTIVDGELCHKTEDENPMLFDSHDEAFKEIFDDATTMLDGYSDHELKEYCEGVTPAMVQRMKELNSGTDVEAMKQFMQENPQCNYNDEFVLPAEGFVDGRKAIFTGN